MFKRVFIVAKTVLGGATRRSITGLPIHSTIRYFVNFIALFELALSILKVCNFWRSNTASQNHTVIRQVLISLANLVLSSGLAQWKFRRSNSHSLTRLVELVITRLAPFHYFFLLCSILQISVVALLLNPYTWKSSVFHQLLAQKKLLRTLNLSK